MGPGRRSRKGRRLPVLLFSLALAMAVLVPADTATASAPTDLPAAGQWFEYNYDIYLDSGQGNYSGYTETTTEHYRYQIESVVGDNVTVLGNGNWAYSDSMGHSSQGGWTETFSFSDVTREYLHGFDVNGTFAGQPYRSPTVWFWVPTPLSTGQTLQILDENYSVKSLSATVWLGSIPLPRLGMELESSGSFLRNDNYGLFSATWDDQYFYDAQTGLIIAEIYTEHDADSAGDGFQWRELASVTSSSYPIPYDWVSLLGVYVGIPGAAVVVLGTDLWYHRGPRRATVRGKGGEEARATVRRIRRPGPSLGLAVDSTSPYGPFLPLIIRRARQRKAPVWVATNSGRLLGAMVKEKEAKVTTIFTQDAGLARLLRSMSGARNFFAEVPSADLRVKAGPIDSFQVLALSPVVPVQLDTSEVRALQPEHMDAVVRLAEAVYGLKEPKWLRQAFEDGDLGFSAWSQGDLVGFAFATVSGDQALLHTLTVDPRARGRGLGKALMAARLNALVSLGVQKVIVEVSVHNPPMLSIARQFGFQPVGETTYYARRPKKAIPADRRPF